MIRILYVNGGLMNRGGIESYMMNYYRHFDRSKIQIDFIVHDAGGYGYYDEEIKKMGGRIFVLPKKSTHPFTYIHQLKKILNNGEYKIIHTHMDAMGAWVLKIAEECGVPVRIAHSHNTQHLSTNPLKLFFLEKARKNINKYATHRMACSDVAGRWLFGDKPFTVVHNAIEVERFAFDEEERKRIRELYGVRDDEFLIGHVGRFDTQKNHSFLIDVFADVVREKPNCKLMLVGEGHLMQSIKEKVSRLKLDKNVVFTGVRDDAYKYYNAFDLFVLPSLFEGLGIVAIEAEVNGCPSLLSSQVPQAAKIAENVSFVDLKKEAWVDSILSVTQDKKDRNGALFNIYESDYNINIESKKLQSLYTSNPQPIGFRGILLVKRQKFILLYIFLA